MRYSRNNFIVPTCLNPNESNTIITGLLVNHFSWGVEVYESNGTILPDVLRLAGGADGAVLYFCFNAEEIDTGSSSSSSREISVDGLIVVVDRV